MPEFFDQVWTMLMGRSHGPLTARLMLQPTLATVLAVRAGYRDSRAGRPPYFWSLFGSATDRARLLEEGWGDVGKVFLTAVSLDVIYEVIVYRWIYPGQAIIVGTALAIIPYLFVRGLTTRLMTCSDRGREIDRSSPE